MRMGRFWHIIPIRKFSNGNNLKSTQLIYEKYEVLKVVTAQVNTSDFGENVVVQWLAAPINPSDINQIQGTYPIKPKEFPGVGGNEGCGRIYSVGPNVNNLKPGDIVIPKISGLGTWSEYGLCHSSSLRPISKDLSVIAASMIKVNPPSAYRMLKDFVTLSPSLMMAQNGANSAVGQCVIQICKILGYKSLNIVRDRPNINELKDKLYELGATHVLTEEESIRNFNDVKLALNCVGGRSSLLLGRVLQPNGCMVTYGGMSQQPVQIMTSSFIFNDIILKGFWMSRWAEKPENYKELNRMYDELTEWYKDGKMKPVEYQTFKLSEYQNALSANSSIGKQIFIME